MLYRPLSFTRNLGGPQKVYDAVRQAYQAGISIGDFRRALAPGMSRDQSLIITEFFLASEIRNGVETVHEDQLIRSCLELPLSSLHMRLALFALNLNLPGQRLKAAHRNPAPAQNAYVREFLLRDGAWQASVLHKDAMRQWLTGHLSQRPAGITKFRNNYHYLFAQCGFRGRQDGPIDTFAEEWYRPALRLYFERLRLVSPPATGSPEGLEQSTRADGINRLLGVSEPWLSERLTAELRSFLGHQPVQLPAPAAPEAEAVGPAARRLLQVAQIERDTQAVGELKALYGYRCQVCGIRLRTGRNTYYAVGAHIRPLGQPHDGPDVRGNIVILCPNHHMEMDAGVISISPTDGVTVHHAFEDNAVHEKPLTLMPGHTLGREYLQYHWDNLYLPNRAQN